MYPIECFNAQDTAKVEAVRYYVDLNKAFLKETAVEEYEIFSEFMKGEGKDILHEIANCNNDKELAKLLAKIEAKLPYGKKTKALSFEQKIQAIHKELAKNAMHDADEIVKDKKAVLKEQRQMAEMYDSLVETCRKYRDAVLSLQTIKDATLNQDVVKKMFMQNQNLGKEDFVEALQKSVMQAKAKVKEARSEAFNSLREYSVKEFIQLLEQEKNSEMQK